MKKAYSTPEILFESFELQTSIAAGCKVRVNTYAENQCGYEYGAFTVFLNQVNGCMIKIEDGSGLADGLCYDVPIEGMALFNS